MRKHKVFGLLVILLALCFVFAGCDSSSSSDPAPGPGDSGTRPQPGDPIGGPPPGGVPSRPPDAVPDYLMRDVIGFAERPVNWVFDRPVGSRNAEGTEAVVSGGERSFTNADLTSWFMNRIDGGFNVNAAGQQQPFNNGVLAGTVSSHAALWRFLQVPGLYFGADADFDELWFSFETANERKWIPLLSTDTTVQARINAYGFQPVQAVAIPGGGTGIAHQIDFAARSAVDTSSNWAIALPFLRGNPARYDFFKDGEPVGYAIIAMPRIDVGVVTLTIPDLWLRTLATATNIPVNSADWPEEVNFDIRVRPEVIPAADIKEVTHFDGLSLLALTGRLPLLPIPTEYGWEDALGDLPELLPDAAHSFNLEVTGETEGIAGSPTDLRIDIAYSNPRNLFPNGSVNTLFVLFDTEGALEDAEGAMFTTAANSVKRIMNGDKVGMRMNAAAWEDPDFMLFATAPGTYTITFTLLSQPEALSGNEQVIAKKEIVYNVQENFLGRNLKFALNADLNPFAATNSDFNYADLGTPSSLLIGVIDELQGVTGVKGGLRADPYDYYGLIVSAVTWEVASGYTDPPLGILRYNSAGTAAEVSEAIKYASVSDLYINFTLRMEGSQNRFSHLEFPVNQVYPITVGSRINIDLPAEVETASASDFSVRVMGTQPDSLQLQLRFINRGYIAPPNG